MEVLQLELEKVKVEALGVQEALKVQEVQEVQEEQEEPQTALEDTTQTVTMAYVLSLVVEVV